ncbi:MAG: hypothetical protein ASARMPREDX12_006297 [Alectoria sarmentosa]|nr:MAG: hypothetical protein ASARMPREDX12_006297 [Alectoria sarmentosa]
MSSLTSTGGRGRIKVTNTEADSDSEGSDVTAQTFSDAVSGKFKYRSRVKEYQNSVEFPLPPLFAVNEVVYLVVPGRNQPAGPFAVSASMGNKQYKIKRVDNGEEHPTTVTEDKLVVLAT